MSMEPRKDGLNQKRGGVEKGPKHDFRRIFLEKLGKIEPIPEEDRQDQASGFETIGIKKLKREAPVLLLNLPGSEEDEQSFDLWVTDPTTIHHHDQPHVEVERDLAKFLGVHEEDPEFPKYPVGGAILQDDDGLLYLLVDEIRSKRFGYYLDDDKNRVRLLDLLQRYGISKVAGRFWRKHREGDKFWAGGETETIIDQDLIGERREDLRLLDIAKKYNMTNTQYMRFRILAKSAIDAVKQGKIKEPGVKILRDVEEIAKEVVEADKK